MTTTNITPTTTRTDVQQQTQELKTTRITSDVTLMDHMTSLVEKRKFGLKAIRPTFGQN